MPRRTQRPLLQRSILQIVVVTLLLSTVVSCNKYDHVKAQTANQRAISLACQLYHTSYGTYPGELSDPGLAPFLDGDFAPLVDEWGNHVRYQLTDTGFVLTSLGPDKQYGTPDDIRITGPQSDL
ncbi:hypothetical protein [Crateriforma spongiae]|uniref:hypothetical protein n=1 Tax=Crateriforma spongiae TaxID=2724528 RepID=UPI001445AAD4|nr:hypothetical protein [Crateriforma spongiae]